MNEKQYEGLLTIGRNREAILWLDPLNKHEKYYRLDHRLISKYGLVNGARIRVEIRNNNIEKIISICGKEPAGFITRKAFPKLVAGNPEERFDFGSSGINSLRIIDMFVPIGKGTRALIVSPPRAGKTVLLEELTRGLLTLDPDLRVILLLIDERPEEITNFQITTNALIFHRSMDKDTVSQVTLSNLVIDHIRTELECGNDLVILVDSLTRLARSYNRNDNLSRGRTMSGGLGSNALEIPRKLFGMARNVQGGGSCTILATILRDTGSRMDDVIFQEFKGTGNSEIILDRELAEERIFPAIDLRESGTRKDELLLAADDLESINSLRRKLFGLNNSGIITSLINLFEKYPDNRILLQKYSSTL